MSFITTHLSGCPSIRTAGHCSCCSSHRVAIARKDETTNLWNHHKLRKILPGGDQRIFNHQHCPDQIKRRALDSDVSTETKIPLTHSYLNGLRENWNVCLFSIPNLPTSIFFGDDQYFGDIFISLKGLKKVRTNSNEKRQPVIWKWYAISRGAGRKLGPIPLLAVVCAQTYHRKSTGFNFFPAEKDIVCDDGHGNDCLVHFAPDGRISIPKCDCFRHYNHVRGEMLV